MTAERFVLPTNVTPTHYVLTLEPDLKAFTFKGKIVVSLTVNEESKSIVFNGAEITLGTVIVTQNDQKESVTSDNIVEDKDHYRFSLALSKPLQKGTATLEIDYTGELNDKMRGFYRSKYSVSSPSDPSKAEERYMAVTQFEPVSACLAFPCWDEPNLKITCDTILIIPKELTGLTNTELIKEEEVDGGKKKLTFATTPKLSTYLLGFAVGDFIYTEKVVKKTHSKEDTIIRVYTRPGIDIEDQAALSIDVAVKSLAFYEKFFEMDYQLKKCDMIAVPDFAQGAMENWGIITYRETAILGNANSAFWSKFYIALTVSHELAHMWFGNTVTMDWWKELWLNESFATYMEHLVVAEYFPEWKNWCQFVADDFNSALRLDGMLSSHPVEVDIVYAHTIDEIFDNISYAKGCSLMRMLVSWIGPEAFQKAMAIYINRHAYSNTTTTDLWAALEETSKMPVSEVMSNWTAKQGYPILRVKRGSGENELVVTQNRYLSSTITPPEEEDAVVWSIPIFVGSSSFPEGERFLLKERVNTISLNGLKDASWVKVNLNHTAVARVLYEDEELLEKILGALSKKSLSVEDATGFLADLTAFSVSGHSSAVHLLKALEASKDSDDLTIWSTLASALGEIQHMIIGLGAEASDLFGKFCIKVYQPLAEKLGWSHKPEDDERTKQLRGQAFGTLATYGHEDTLAKARAGYAAYRVSNKDEDLPSDFRGRIYRALVFHGGEEEWKDMKLRYEKNDDAAERSRALGALGKTKDPALLEQSLAYVLDGCRKQDVAVVLDGVAFNPKGHCLHKEFLKKNFSTIADMVVESPVLHRVLKSFSYSTDKGDIDTLKTWWKTIPENHVRYCGKVFDQVTERIEVYSKFAERDSETVLTFLKSSN